MNIRGRCRSIAFQKDLRLSSWRMAYPSFIVFRATSPWNYRVCRPPQLAASFITSHASNVAYWHRLCENALAEALTTRDFGEVAVFGRLLCLERLLMRIPAVLSGAASGYGHMSATIMPASPPAAVGRP